MSTQHCLLNPTPSRAVCSEIRQKGTKCVWQEHKIKSLCHFRKDSSGIFQSHERLPARKGDGEQALQRLRLELPGLNGKCPRLLGKWGESAWEVYSIEPRMYTGSLGAPCLPKVVWGRLGTWQDHTWTSASASSSYLQAKLPKSPWWIVSSSIWSCLMN